MKKLIFISVTIFLFGEIQSQIPTLDWAISMGGSGNEEGFSVVIGDNSIYVTGSFQGTVDFDPGPGVYNLTSNGFYDIFIQKLDANGNFIWAKSLGQSASDRGFSITTDANENIYIAGKADGNIDFDPGIGVFNLNINSGTFLLKLDSAGNFIWAKETSSSSSPGRVYYDKFGNILLTGEFLGNVDFDPGPGTFILNSGGIFIQKVDTNGNFVWAKHAEGNGAGFDIITDLTGNIYSTGASDGVVDFDPGSGIYNPTFFGSQDIYIQKSDVNGNLLWVKTMGNNGFDNGHSIVIDSSGNLYITGTFQGIVDFDPGPNVFNLTESSGFIDNAFVLKLDSSGNFKWAYSLGAPGLWESRGKSITIDMAQNVYVAGDFADAVDFDPGVGTNMLGINGGNGVFVQKIDTGGNLIWAVATENTTYSVTRSIITDVSGSVYMTGDLGQTIDFDPSNGVYNLTSNGGSDIYVFKLDQNAVGINEVESGFGVTIYPNPTNGLLTIDNIEAQTIKIMDVTGKTLKIIQLKTNTINVADLPNGIYFIQLISKEITIIKKFVKN